MKRKLFTLFALAMASQQLLMAEDINISASFPDENLRKELSDYYDSNGDGVLSDAERSNITSLGLSNHDIKDLTGIGLLTSLTHLDVANNDITALPGIGQLTSLTSLNVSNTSIAALDLSTLSNLTTLTATNNGNLATVNISGLEKLESINFSNCALTSITLTNLPKLTSIEIGSNPDLTAIDVSQLSELEALQATYTGLTSIDVSGLTKLNLLGIDGCEHLTDINAKGCTALTSFYIPAASPLKSINLANCTAMTSFYIDNNSTLERLNISGCKNLQNVSACNLPKLTTLNVDGCTSLITLSVYNNESLTSFAVSGLDNLENLNLSGCGMRSIDLTGMPKLARIDIYDNPELTAIDVSQLSELERLTAYNTGLKTIDVSGLTKLEHLYLYNSKDLTDINAKGCTALSVTDSFGNDDFPALKSINLTGCTALTSLSLYNEHIERLDLSGCTGFSNVSLGNTKNLTTLNLDGSSVGYLTFSYSDALTQLDLRKAAVGTLEMSYTKLVESVKLAKPENLYIYNNEKLANIEIADQEALTNVNIYSNGVLKQLDLSGCKVLKQASLTDNESLESLTVNSPALTMLIVSNNRLTALDLSNCTALEALTCVNNQLSTLDLSKNTKLNSLSCSSNRLTALDLSKNTLLTSASTTQYPEYTLVKLSATEVGFPVSEGFDPDNIEENSFYNGFEYKAPTYATVDGVRYFLVHNNAATAEEELEGRSMRYSYNTGNKDFPLDNYITIKGFTKAPSFLKLSAESVKGVYGASLAAPELTRSQAYDGTVSYKSANTGVVKVDADGQLTVVGAGTTSVTVSGTEAEYRLAPADVTYGVTIEKASPVFKFGKAALDMIIKDEVPANTLDKGVYDGTVVYKSSNEKVATVANDGKVTVVAAGEVTITAHGDATKNCNAPTAASYTLTIKKRTTTLTLAAASTEGVYGGKAEAPAVNVNGYDGTVAYASGDEKVVKVAKDGKLTIVGAGTTTVTVSAPETPVYYAPASVSYTVTIAKASPTFSFAKPTVEANRFDAAPENPLTTGIYDGTVTYSSSNEDVAEVDAKTGALTLKKAGEAKISVAGEATANCNAAAADYQLTVTMIPGDVNNDKAVNVTDVTLTIAYILMQAPKGFIPAAADINNDGEINVTDVTSIIDLVLAK